LYQFTVHTNGVKEINSVVDFGFHFVATVGSNASDSDGGGTWDLGAETDWNDAETDGDGVDHFLEWRQGRNGSTNAVTGAEANLAYSPR
jgi:hypothetical protein